MGTAKFDDGVPSNMKIIAAGAVASWLWFCGVIYCRRALTDGFIPLAVVPTLSIGLKSPMTHAAKLVEVGLWEQVENGYLVHDFLDWNPSKAEMESYREKDRNRKQSKHGIQSDAARIPNGFHADSEKIPRATAYTRGTHAGAKSESVCKSESESERSDLSEKSTRETNGTSALAPNWRKAGDRPLSINTHQQHAFCPMREGLCVHEKLHREFLGKLGGSRTEAELFAWYPTALALFENRAIGEDTFTFWRNSFGLWVGTVTSAPSTQSARPTRGASNSAAWDRAAEMQELINENRNTATGDRAEMALDRPTGERRR